MSESFNLKLKDGVEPSVLVKYGFVPKYDENTGEVNRYVKKYTISGEHLDELLHQHFTFELHTTNDRGFFRRFFHYEAWMSGFRWGNLCEKETVQMLYDLIKDGIVEPAKMG